MGREGTEKSQPKALNQIITGLTIIVLLASAAIIVLALVRNPKKENGEQNDSESTRIAAADLTATFAPWTSTAPPPTATITVVSTWTPSPTPASTVTPLPSATGLPVTPQPQTLYATGDANLRPCPYATAECEPVDQVHLNDRLNGLGMVNGENIGGNALWYQISYGNLVLYVHSSVVSNTKPVPQAPAQPVIVQPAATAAGSPFGCNGRNDLDCSDFYAIGQSANAHLAQCGNEDHLDGDGDGRACERW